VLGGEVVSALAVVPDVQLQNATGKVAVHWQRHAHGVACGRQNTQGQTIEKTKDTDKVTCPSCLDYAGFSDTGGVADFLNKTVEQLNPVLALIQRGEEATHQAVLVIEGYQRYVGKEKIHLEHLAKRIGVHVVTLYRWMKTDRAIQNKKATTPKPASDVLRMTCKTVEELLELTKRGDVELVQVVASYKLKVVTP
jgi:hypothetical protein